MAYADDVLNQYGSSAFNRAAQLPSQRAAFNLGQKTEQQDYLERLRGAQAKQEALPHMYTRISNELGIPNLQQAVTTLGKTVAELPQTYSAATRGFDVNANQLSRIIAQKSGELAPALQSAQQALAGAQQEAGTRIQYGATQQAKELEPYKTEQQLLSDRQAREATGFSEDNQLELNTLIEKLKQGVALTEGEKTRANQLAIAEKQYETQLKIAQLQADTSKYSADKQAEGTRLTALATLAKNF